MMGIRAIFSSLNISASALSVQRQRMDVVAKNLANVNTTRTAEGGPYQREVVVVREKNPAAQFRELLEAKRLQLSQTDQGHMMPLEYTAAGRKASGGVEIDDVVRENAPPKVVYDPQHPDADEDGYVRLPNINAVTEMVDIISATRAYEANLTVIDAAKNVVKKALEI